MINLELYRIFKTVAEEEKLTKASEILHISQPAVTKHVSMGTVLFDTKTLPFLHQK